MLYARLMAMLRAADLVVTMGYVDTCPVVLESKYIHWALDEPAVQDLAGVRPIRDEIAARVIGRLEELGAQITHNAGACTQ